MLPSYTLSIHLLVHVVGLLKVAGECINNELCTCIGSVVVV